METVQMTMEEYKKLKSYEAKFFQLRDNIEKTILIEECCDNDGRSIREFILNPTPQLEERLLIIKENYYKDIAQVIKENGDLIKQMSAQQTLINRIYQTKLPFFGKGRFVYQIIIG